MTKKRFVHVNWTIICQFKYPLNSPTIIDKEWYFYSQLTSFLSLTVMTIVKGCTNLIKRIQAWGNWTWQENSVENIPSGRTSLLKISDEEFRFNATSQFIPETQGIKTPYQHVKDNNKTCKTPNKPYSGVSHSLILTLIVNKEKLQTP